MVGVLKKVIVLLVVLFCLFYVITRPEGAANVVEDGFNVVIDAFSQVGVFVNALLG